MAEKTAGKQRGRPFRRGESGNPAGRPIGARHKATIVAEALLDGEAEGLTRKVLEMALAGDTVAKATSAALTTPRIAHRAVKGFAIYGCILRTPNYIVETQPMPAS